MEKLIVTVTLNPALDKTVTVSDLKVGGLNRVNGIRIDPGGKGINVAKVLKSFGVNVEATGLIAGEQGDLLLKYLGLAGISTDFYRVPGETRTNLKIVDDINNITTEINENGFFVDNAYLKMFVEKLSNRLDDVSFLILSGSVPPGVYDKIYYDLIQIARAKGVRTILDADGILLTEGIKAIPFAIKPNVYELENLANKNLSHIDDIAKVTKSLTSMGIETVVVSMGHNGALVSDNNNTYITSTFNIIPGSTVGAGDSMVAALAYCAIKGYSLYETSRWVTAAGTISASKQGTEVCTYEEVRQNVEKIVVKDYVIL